MRHSNILPFSSKRGWHDSTADQYNVNDDSNYYNYEEEKGEMFKDHDSKFKVQVIFILR